MNFCQECGNMLYIKISDNLIYYCRKCGFEKTGLTEDNICVSKIFLTKQKNKVHNMINEFTKMDPTLPRITNIKCPSVNCPSNKDEGAPPAEIIYLRYDDVNMKFVYLCSVCDTIWKLNKNKIELN